MEENNTFLTPQEELNIIELVKKERGKLDIGRGPIGKKIFSVLRDNDIQLMFFFSEQKDSDGLLAFYLRKNSSITNLSSFYIAVNTAVPLDLQIFNTCHEYYHHIDIKMQNLHVRRTVEPDEDIVNAKANRFAAEFLLPTESLEIFVKKHNRGEIDLGNWESVSLMRLIAQLQIDYQVPYRMIVKRLNEIKAIKGDVKDQLLLVDERDENSTYYKIGKTINDHTFNKINSIVKKTGIEPEALIVILQNYDERQITIDTAMKDLSLFNKSVEDFGYDIEVFEEDIDEIVDLFGDD